jgi:Trk K+ transport system NAD-binding subunit
VIYDMTPRAERRAAPDREGLDLVGRRFVLSGSSRLAVRVAELLAGDGAEVSVIGDHRPELDGRLGSAVRHIPTNGDHAEALRAAGVETAECLLLLADDDLDNLRAALASQEVAPSIPVVLRAFDATISDQLERGLNVRRAYSVSSLAAPNFVAAALGADVVETLRSGDVEVPIVGLDLRAGSSLAGLTASQVKRRTRCALVGRVRAGASWEPAVGDDHVLETGDRIVVGGRLPDVLQVARQNGTFPTAPAHTRLRDRWAALRGRRGGGWRSGERRRGAGSSTLLPIAAAALAVLVLATMIIFAVALHLSPIEALYQAVLTAFGSPSLPEAAWWLKVVAVSAVIAGGALVGVLFGFVAAYATTERLEQRMGRRAHHLRDHVVLAGVGDIGYRIERQLFELGIPTVIVERSPDPRYLSAVGERTPVLAGDIRLQENLERAGIAHAACIVACTDDDLANVEACIQARRLNPAIRTVARIFDAELADRMTSAFGVDVALSANAVAARAFVGAAVDERALRPFRLGDVPYLALRFEPGRTLDGEEIRSWRAAGVRVLALRHHEGPTLPPSPTDERLTPGDHAVLAGPAEAITSLVLPLAGTS